MKFKIELINIGREKVNREKIVDAKDFNDAGVIAFKEVSKYLISSNVELIPQDNSYGYNVFAGFHKVGEVKITEV